MTGFDLSGYGTNALKMYNKDVNEITNVNAHSKSFDFLADEPELYSILDLKREYN